MAAFSPVRLQTWTIQYSSEGKRMGKRLARKITNRPSKCCGKDSMRVIREVVAQNLKVRVGACMKCSCRDYLSMDASPWEG